MPLSDAEIARLLALPNRRGSKPKGPDISQRDFSTWFKLAQKMIDEETRELQLCENSNCQDPRAIAGDGNGIVVAEVNGKFMCRYCFLDGWLLIPEAQTTITS